MYFNDIDKTGLYQKVTPPKITNQSNENVNFR